MSDPGKAVEKFMECLYIGMGSMCYVSRVISVRRMVRPCGVVIHGKAAKHGRPGILIGSKR